MYTLWSKLVIYKKLYLKSRPVSTVSCPTKRQQQKGTNTKQNAYDLVLLNLGPLRSRFITVKLVLIWVWSRSGSNLGLGLGMRLFSLIWRIAVSEDHTQTYDFDKKKIARKHLCKVVGAISNFYRVFYQKQHEKNVHMLFSDF